jgi:AraC-like DNA-binding protein
VTARYAEFAPRAGLADHVACLWVFEGRDADEDQRIAPDGCCELILHLGEPYLERGADGALVRQPRTLFAGQLTRPLHLRAEGHSHVIGVRFRTAGAHAYFGGAMDAVTDRRAPWPAIGLTATDETGRLAQLQDHVAGEIARHGCPVDPVIDRCVALLEAGATIEALCRETGLAHRTLQRRFAVRIGISPRMLAAVIRFRRVFEALRDATSATWTQTAHEAGYFDHPQMARDFRRFVGCTPSLFVAARPGLAVSLVDLPA